MGCEYHYEYQQVYVCYHTGLKLATYPEQPEGHYIFYISGYLHHVHKPGNVVHIVHCIEVAHVSPYQLGHGMKSMYTVITELTFYQQQC